MANWLCDILGMDSQANKIKQEKRIIMSTIISDLKAGIKSNCNGMNDECRHTISDIGVPEFSQAYDGLCDAILEIILAKVDTAKVEGELDNAVNVLSMKYLNALSAVLGEVL